MMLGTLQQVEAFREVPQDKLDCLSQQGRPRFFAAGSELIHQGEVGDALYVILVGRVQVERDHPALLAPLVLAELGPGDMVGEMGVLDRAPRSATVVALDDIEALEIDRETLARTLHSLPEAPLALLQLLTLR